MLPKLALPQPINCCHLSMLSHKTIPSPCAIQVSGIDSACLPLVTNHSLQSLLILSPGPFRHSTTLLWYAQYACTDAHTQVPK